MSSILEMKDIRKFILHSACGTKINLKHVIFRIIMSKRKVRRRTQFTKIHILKRFTLKITPLF